MGDLEWAQRYLDLAGRWGGARDSISKDDDRFDWTVWSFVFAFEQIANRSILDEVAAERRSLTVAALESMASLISKMFEDLGFDPSAHLKDYDERLAASLKRLANLS